MANIISLEQADFKKLPEKWIDLARELASGNIQDDHSLFSEIAELEIPSIEKLRPVRKSFWALLAEDNFFVGLRWLDKIGMLDIILPCWSGNGVRRKLRLNALENYAKEPWKKFFDDSVMKNITDIHEVIVDRRLKRWSLTAIAIMFAGGDTENQNSWAKMTRRDLHEFGATEAELVWIERIIREFNQAMLFVRGVTDEYILRPELAVAVLSTMKTSDPDLFKEAATRANKALLNQVGPLD